MTVQATLHGKSMHRGLRRITLMLWFVAASALWAPAGQASVDRLLEEAQAAQNRRDFTSAAEKYGKAAILDPDAAIFEKQGLSYFMANTYTPAVKAFSQALERDPKRWASQLFLGESLYKLDRFQEALPHLASSLDLNPRQNETRFWLGCVYHALGRFDEAQARLMEASGADPNNTDILYALTQTYLDESAVLADHLTSEVLRAQRRSVIEAQISAVSPSASSDGESWKSAVSRLQALADHYKTASQSDPTALFALSLTYGQLGQLMAERVLKLDPDSYRSHELLGQSLESQGNYQSALLEYGRALQVNPTAPGLSYGMGHAYWEMKQFTAAIPPLEAELQLNPAHASANYLLGHIYLHVDPPQLEKAVFYLQRAIAANPKYFAAREQLGQTYSLMNRDQEAVQQFELAAREDPRDDRVHYLLARVYRKMGLDDKAKRELETFNQLRAAKSPDATATK